MVVLSKYKWLWYVHLPQVAIQEAEVEEVEIEEGEALVEVEAVVDVEEETAEMESNLTSKEGREIGGKYLTIF